MLALDSLVRRGYVDAAYLFDTGGYRRDLLSFPTRRSSDLSRLEAGISRLRLEPVALAPFLQEAVQDRKSTRLNSSHRSISYAAFCLKRKSHAPPPHRAAAPRQRVSITTTYTRYPDHKHTRL